MRIMMIAGYYDPEITASLYLLSNIAEDLTAKGCTVDVVTPAPVRGIDDKTRCLYRSIKRETKFGGRLVIHRVFVPFNEPRGILLRAVRYILTTAALFLKALTIKTDIILVNSTPPTLGLIGAWIRCIKGVPAVFNLQDIFPDSMINDGITDNGFLVAIGKWMEQLIYSSMDRIVTISQDFKRNIMQKGVPEAKIEVVYNWTDESMVVPVCRTENILLGRYGLSRDAFFVTYCGNIGHTQNLELLIDVAKSLEGYHDLQFVIIGDGVHKQDLVSYAKGNDVQNLRFLPFQPIDEISHVFSLGDASLVISKQHIGRSSFPSKTWSIMSAARPVLASFDEDSELCAMIDEAHCGICVPPEDFYALRGAVIDVYERRIDVETLGKNGRQFILSNLSRHMGTDRWFHILNNMVSSRSSFDN